MCREIKPATSPTNLRACFEALVDVDAREWRPRMDALDVPPERRDRLMFMLVFTRLVETPEAEHASILDACGVAPRLREDVCAAIARRAVNDILSQPVTLLWQDFE